MSQTPQTAPGGQTPQNAPVSSHALSLSKTFSWLGWTGFWLQVVLGSLPVLTLVYYFSFTDTESAPGPRGFPFIQYLAVINILTTLFTVYWSFHYTRLGRRIKDPERSPSPASLMRSAWTGVIASTIGIFFSTLVILLESGNLLFAFLKAPQAGLGGGLAQPVRWVSTLDMFSLVALILTLFAEVIVLAFNNLLLFRTTPRSSEAAVPAEVGSSAPDAAVTVS
jgi:hypothetical protein